jgi:phospholipase C
MLHRTRSRLLSYVSMAVMMANAAQPALAATTGPHDGDTTTPIKHVIIIVGENRTFDHLFATYVPPAGTVQNLLSAGIINADGTPGPNAAIATQSSASDTSAYSIAPGGKAPYTTGGANPFPPVMTGSAHQNPSDTTGAPFATKAVAQYADYGLENADIGILLTGATGLPEYSIDTRFPNAATPANGPYQLTPGISYDDYAVSPVHRFYQMFQQMDCSAANATAANPSGCLNDLFPWVETTIGAGSNGAAAAGALHQPDHRRRLRLDGLL